MGESERGGREPAPDERVNLRITVSVGTPGRDWKRKIAEHIASTVDFHRIPRCHDTWIQVHLCEIAHIILHRQRYSVDYGGEAVVEDSDMGLLIRLSPLGHYSGRFQRHW